MRSGAENVQGSGFVVVRLAISIQFIGTKGTRSDTSVGITGNLQGDLLFIPRIDESDLG